MPDLLCLQSDIYMPVVTLRGQRDCLDCRPGRRSQVCLWFEDQLQPVQLGVDVEFVAVAFDLPSKVANYC